MIVENKPTTKHNKVDREEAIITVLPFSGGRVDVPKQFISGHCLGVEVHPDWFQFHVGIGFVEGAKDSALPSASVANHKD